MHSSSSAPNRRSAIPNTIYDDFAFRRFNQSSPSGMSIVDSGNQSFKAFNYHKATKRKQLNSYMSRVTYDNHSPDKCSFECPYCDDITGHISFGFKCPMNQYGKFPDLIADDVLNRRIRQSSGAKVLAPQPPFGIPNSPVISFLHTFPEADYSRVEPDFSQLTKRSYRVREREPHLINDDMAFRNLRKDYQNGYKLDDENYWKGQVLLRSASSPDLSIKTLRYNLRSVQGASLTSSPESLSPLFAASPTFNVSSFS